MGDVAHVDHMDIPTNGFQDPQITEVNGETSSKTDRLPVTVTKPIPYTFDLGHLTCFDANPLKSFPTTTDIDSTARDCAQSILNQLLTTCPINSTPDGVHVSLPQPTFLLPREKPVPTPKEETTWQKFAKKKGIAPKKREGKTVYDEATGEWVPKYGYKGVNKKGENEWLVEVDEKKEKATGEAGDVRRERRAERKERVKRQERKERSNVAKNMKK